MRAAFEPALQPAITTAVKPALGYGGDTLPRQGLLWLVKGEGMVDSIGLFVSDAEVVEPGLWSIFYNLDGNGQPVSKRADADIIASAVASPLLNFETMIGREGSFLALYQKDTSQSTLSKARKVAKCMTYTGMSIYGDIREFGLPKTPKWYVDSDPTKGNDSNDGLSKNTPLLTIAALLAKNIVAGDVIGLAAGSEWREKVGLAELTSVFVCGYGSGKRPILDCSDVALNSNFSLIGGRTYTYQISWGYDTESSGEFLSVWEDGLRLTYVADEATCESSAGSYTCATTGINPITIKIHPRNGTNPTTDGKIYEISKRIAAINGRGQGCCAINIAAKNNLGNNGSLVLSGNQSALINCIGIDGTKHNIFMSDGIVQDCVAWKCDTSARTDQTMFVAYVSDGVGKSVKHHRCLAKPLHCRSGITGFYTHTSGDGKKYDSVSWVDCSTTTNGWGGQNVKKAKYIRTYGVDCEIPFYILCEELQMIDPFFNGASINRNMTRGIQSTASVSAKIEGARGTVKNGNAGIIYISTPDLVVNKSVFLRLSGGSGYTMAIRHYSAGSYQASGNIFNGLDEGHASRHASSVVSETDNNCFYPSTMHTTIGNVTYANIAAYKSAQPTLDQNSVIGDPLFTDPTNGDFSLQTGSPAIAIGAGIERPNIQYLEILSDEILEQW